jgi:hypothetical protein
MKLRVPFLIAAILAASAVHAADSMRCGNRLVSGGDPKAKVAEVCGQPSQVERRTVLRSGFPRTNVDNDDARVRTVSDTELLVHDRSLVEVQVEVWLYNRGRTSLLRELVFHDNRLVAVNVLGHGY